jgi:hypothetical protein
MKEIWSRYPLRNLGWASDGEVLLAEEDRESHIHILGAPGEGKSKLLELLVRQDIDRGYGCCLLDPSDNGDTAYKILKYCLKIGYEKVCLIDPHDNKLCTINPLHPKAPSNVISQNMMDTMRILWGDKGAEGTAKINRYLPHVIKVVHKNKLTLHESIYFTDKSHPRYKHPRHDMLDALHPLDNSRIILESLFSGSPHLFNSEFESTVRRLNPIYDDVFKLIVGSNKSPLNFAEMISKGWVILVNLDPSGIWGIEQQRLLGTLIINEIIHAIYRLTNGGWRGVYYLYIDEVGDYATPKLAHVLDKKRKTGLRFTVAHQRFNQIEDSNVLSAIKGSTKIKVLFNTPNRQDRDEMIRMMYGGNLSDREVSYELSNLQKQHAAIKINKNPPRITRIPDLPDIQVSNKALQDFKEQLYRRDWYYSRQEILTEINARFKQPGRSHAQQRPDLGNLTSSKVSSSRRHRTTSEADGVGNQPHRNEGPPIPREPRRDGEDTPPIRKKRNRKTVSKP